jgi:superfamily I DNA and/or RNA helicase
MEYALKFLLETKEERISYLKNVLLGDIEAQFTEINPIKIPQLNESQNRALNLVQNALDVAIIHGPPGTGKTTTLIQTIIQTLKSETQILVCAPSNAAVDLIVEKLTHQGVNTLRIGHPARVTQEILSTTLDARITQHLSYKDLKTVRKQAEEYRNLALKYKRNYGPEEREQRRLLLTEARKLRDETKRLVYYITDDIISKTRVIASTLVGAANMTLKGMKFKTVFIDEAAQGLEPATWIPILKAERVIFAGDHCQLPPTIKSFEAAKSGLDITLFEKAIKRNNADVMLNEQYRMNKKIMNFSNRFFYKNELTANSSVADWKIFADDLAIEFVDTAGCGFFEQVDEETKSTSNIEEAELLKKHLTQYVDNLESNGIFEDVQNIGIISPYSAQVKILKETILDNSELSEECKSKIAINTVDSFQGQERDIVYISLVRSNEKGEIGFLADTRRMNVAMTRARKKLVIFGDSSTISRNQFYNQFIDYINEIEAYKSAYEFMY